MKRIKLTVAYDGTNYCGWQIQPNGITVQEVLEKCLEDLTGKKTEIIGASRTDAGVHALGNVAVFDTDMRMPGEKFSFALNQRLPEDIRIQKAQEVPLDFHPRYRESEKTYVYRILNRQFPIPTLRLYTHFTYVPLDIEKMSEGGRYLVGEHDFKSFCGAGAQVKTTVRRVQEVSVSREGPMITIKVRGKGFLYNMVRIIAGSLMEIGGGMYPPEHIKEILEARDRQAAGPTAPAKGLTLVGIRYLPDQGEESCLD
ncbi:MAG TPA: tRNA pseudouridine(38-40) synthase TruA [Candidatus Blautia merdigallinarum]|uniref:tRNA pseudouridine synthase A n=1 Tax=Candidatus Blautia merdigallinarum TaxID=2838495 RepID=A0A9D2N4A5_9FIRM|nr:tRNA pseudouridine(38-40) synthase TruA [Candidatus Blautia merdigallinarum]